MGYEVKKVIEFGQGKERPIGLLKGAILVKDGREPCLQLKLCNNGKDILSKVTVKITCIGKDGEVIGEQHYTYEKIFVTSGMEFGTDVAIPLKYNNTYTVSVELEKNLQSLKISSEKVLKSEWSPIWFPKVYNIAVASLSILLALYHYYVAVSLWNLMAGNINYIPWVFGGGYGQGPQLFAAIAITTIIYLYPIIQVLLNREKTSYKRLLISNLAFGVSIICVCGMDIWSEFAGFAGCCFLSVSVELALILIHAFMIKDFKNKICLLLLGIVIIFISQYFSREYCYSSNMKPVPIIMLSEFLKICINTIGVFAIIKKKFKLV